MVSVAGNLLIAGLDIRHEARIAGEKKVVPKGTLADSLRIDKPVAMTGDAASP
jgi:hypothetical protein